MKLWIARDYDGSLWLFEKEPIYDESIDGWTDRSSVLILESNLYPEVTFENSPMEVELKLVD